MLTKEIMQKMKEDELSRNILIPLLEAMGFHDVFYHHGGSDEQGKDIVCWETDKLHARKNYAVVVKATQISGQAKGGKGTTGEVATQIQQVFGSDYLDPITSETQTVHECWVISNQRILKEGEKAIKSVIKPSSLDRHIRFINGDKLWELVEKHLASQTLMGKFQMIQKQLNNIDTHYQPVIQVSGEEMSLSLREKFKGAATEKPIEFNFSFQFPDTPAGQAAKDALKHHFATGAPVSISPEFIESVDYPVIIKSIFGTENIQPTTLRISPVSNGHHFVARIEIKCDDGDVFTLDHVDFLVQHSGSEEATLENVEATSIIRIKLVVNIVKRSARLTFGWQLSNPSYSCAQLLQLSEFQNCFSKPFNLRVISKEFGLEVFNQRSEQSTIGPPHKFHLNMLRALNKLQYKSSKPIMIPIRELTDEELKDLNRVIHIVLDGRITGKWKEFKVVLDDLSPNAFNGLLTDHLSIVNIGGYETENIFGVELPLGNAECVFSDALISNLDEIREAYNDGRQNIEVQITAKDGESHFEKTYHDFTNPN
jgi:hypothetical protein